MAGTNGWNEWSKHVLLELERLNICYNEIHKDVADIMIEIASLKTEDKLKQRFNSGIWGLVGAMIPTIIMIIFLIANSAGG